MMVVNHMQRVKWTYMGVFIWYEPVAEYNKYQRYGQNDSAYTDCVKGGGKYCGSQHMKSYSISIPPVTVTC